MITVHNKNVTKVEVKRVPLERPAKAGRFWQGIQHGEFIEVLESILMERQWKGTAVGFSITPNGTGLAAAYDIEIPGMKAPSGMNFGIGILHDNNRKRALTIVCGAKVVVCHNGMAVGNVVLKHKHTSRFNLHDKLETGMDRYIEQIGRLDEYVNRWRDFKITGQMSDLLLMSAARAKVLPPTRIYEVDREFRNPSFDYGQDHDNTSLSLYNAFTHIMKKAPARHQLERMDKFGKLLPVSKIANWYSNVEGQIITLI